MKRRTKIVCTLGPAVDSPEMIRRLVDAGMNVARINCSHGDWETRARWIEWVHSACEDTAPVGILVDLQGPKFRLGELPDGMIETVDSSILSMGPTGALPVHESAVLGAVAIGDRVLFGDGDVEVKVLAAEGDNFTVRVLRPGIVKSRQGITISGKVFNVPAITERDRLDIGEASKHGADYIALSYVRSAADMVELRALVDVHDPGIRLCAKIETRNALKELSGILAYSDLVMVARGDMGIQMDIEEVPHAQKRIIRKCLESAKPVITATQMLESMVKASRPTRAEATDIANAILDGTDAVMLSGETAAGQYPIEAVQYMARIAERAESAYDSGILLREEANENLTGNLTHAVAYGVAQLSAQIKPKAIITNTTSGQTARLVSKFRPRAPILCATYDSRIQRQLSVVWGVEAVRVPLPETTDELIQFAIGGFLGRKLLKHGDVVVISAGVPAGKPGNTNLIMVQVV